MVSPIVEINLNNLASNINYIKSIIGNNKLFPVVKANAYGHGLVGIVNYLHQLKNVDGFCVATAPEAKRVLKPGGLAVLMCPDWGTQYKIFWDDYTHVKAWTRKGLQDSMVMHGFNDVNVSLFRQLPITWRYPVLSILCAITSVLPESFKWKDYSERGYVFLKRKC